MCEKFGVPADNFERTYRQWVNWAGDVCNELDRKALVPLAVVFGSRDDVFRAANVS